jgi:protein-tyrosine phosphatase
MSRAGIDISRIRARPFEDRDFEVFDHILVMDREHMKSLADRDSDASRAELRLIMDFARQRPEREVPDPYYGNEAGFELVFSYLEDAAHGVVNELLLPRFATPEI